MAEADVRRTISGKSSTANLPMPIEQGKPVETRLGRAMADGKWISHLRVSTDRQGKSGFGIEAQRSAVGDYLSGGNWSLVKEFVEVESGKRTDRSMLAEAIKACRIYGAKLVIAKLDRLSRDAHFLLGRERQAQRRRSTGLARRRAGAPQRSCYPEAG
jgi:hypothetical protein